MTLTAMAERLAPWQRAPLTAPTFEVYTARDLDRIPQIQALDPERRFAMKVVATVLPFRVNRYVTEHLIDWNDIPNDPLFQLLYPQPGMLRPSHFEAVASRLRTDAPADEIARVVARIRRELNPHPAGQMELNIPRDEKGYPISGLQHKYRETVLLFPSQGQTCHSYCTFCFRWAQFIGDKSLRIASAEAARMHAYLRDHPEVTDVLLTGGDPLVMKTAHLKAYIEPLLKPEFEHIRSIRIGTKALTFWPYRFLDESEGQALLELFTQVVQSGKQLALMAHLNHWRELEPAPTQLAIERVRATGAMIRAQAPLLAHINDNAVVWAKLWQREVELGIVPYYMFVERDTGASHYFKVPLARAWRIYRDALQQVSGLARTVRGPSMSAVPGKVEVLGVSRVEGQRVFVLRFLQGRNPDWVDRPFYARFDPWATWLDELKPAFEPRFFWEEELDRMRGRQALG